MNRLKLSGYTAGIACLLLAVLLCGMSVVELGKIRSADSYEDRGIRSFVPCQVLPVQVKNTSSSGRGRRMNPTRTVYKVYYRTLDGSGYEWTEEAVTEESGRKTVERGEAVERRVLGITGAGTYITVEPELDAESYTAGLYRRYMLILGLSAAYILICLTVWGVRHIAGAL